MLLEPILNILRFSWNPMRPKGDKANFWFSKMCSNRPYYRNQHFHISLNKFHNTSLHPLSSCKMALTMFVWLKVVHTLLFPLELIFLLCFRPDMPYSSIYWASTNLTTYQWQKELVKFYSIINQHQSFIKVWLNFGQHWLGRKLSRSWEKLDVWIVSW